MSSNPPISSSIDIRYISGNQNDDQFIPLQSSDYQNQDCDDYQFTPLPAQFRSLVAAPLLPHGTLQKKPQAAPVNSLLLPNNLTQTNFPISSEPIIITTSSTPPLTIRSSITRDLYNSLMTGYDDLNLKYMQFMSQFEIASENSPSSTQHHIIQSQNTLSNEIQITPHNILPSNNALSSTPQSSFLPTITPIVGSILSPSAFQTDDKYYSIAPPTIYYEENNQLFPSIVNTDVTSVESVTSVETRVETPECLSLLDSQSTQQVLFSSSPHTTHITQSNDISLQNKPNEVTYYQTSTLSTPLTTLPFNNSIHLLEETQPLFVQFDNHSKELNFNAQPQLPGWHAYVSHLYATKQAPLLYGNTVDEWKMWDDYVQLIQDTKSPQILLQTEQHLIDFASNDPQSQLSSHNLHIQDTSTPSNHTIAQTSSSVSEHTLDTTTPFSDSQCTPSTLQHSHQMRITTEYFVDPNNDYSDEELHQIHLNFVSRFKNTPEFLHSLPIWTGLGTPDELLQRRLFDTDDSDVDVSIQHKQTNEAQYQLQQQQNLQQEHGLYGRQHQLLLQLQPNNDLELTLSSNDLKPAEIVTNIDDLTALSQNTILSTAALNTFPTSTSQVNSASLSPQISSEQPQAQTQTKTQNNIIISADSSVLPSQQSQFDLNQSISHPQLNSLDFVTFSSEFYAINPSTGGTQGFFEQTDVQSVPVSDSLTIVREQELERLRRDFKLFGSQMGQLSSSSSSKSTPLPLLPGEQSLYEQLQQKEHGQNEQNEHNDQTESKIPKTPALNQTDLTNDLQWNSDMTIVGEPIYASKDLLVDCLASVQQLDRVLLNSRRTRQQNEPRAQTEVYSINKLGYTDNNNNFHLDNNENTLPIANVPPSPVPTDNQTTSSSLENNILSPASPKTLHSNRQTTLHSVPSSTLSKPSSQSSARTQSFRDDKNISQAKILPKQLHPTHQTANLQSAFHTSLASSIGDNYLYLSTALFQQPLVQFQATSKPHTININEVIQQCHILLTHQQLTFNNVHMQDNQLQSRFNILNTMLGLYKNKIPNKNANSLEGNENTQKKVKSTLQHKDDDLGQAVPQNIDNIDVSTAVQYSLLQLQALMKELFLFKKSQLFFFPHQALSLSPTYHYFNQNAFIKSFYSSNSQNRSLDGHLIPTLPQLFNSFYSRPMLHKNDTMKYLQLLQTFSTPSTANQTPLSQRKNLHQHSSPTNPFTPSCSVPDTSNSHTQKLDKHYHNTVKRRHLWQFLQQFNEYPELNDLYFLSQSPHISSSYNVFTASSAQSHSKFSTDLFYAPSLLLTNSSLQNVTHHLQQRLHSLLVQVPKQFHSIMHELIFTLQPEIKPTTQIGPNGQPIIMPPRPIRVTAISTTIQQLFDLVYQEHIREQFKQRQNNPVLISVPNEISTFSIQASPSIPTNTAPHSTSQNNTLSGNIDKSKTHQSNSMKFRTLSGAIVTQDGEPTTSNDKIDHNNHDLHNIYSKLRANVDKTTLNSAIERSYDNEMDYSILFPSLTAPEVTVDLYSIPSCTCGRIHAFQNWYDKIEAMFVKLRLSKNQPDQPGINILYMMSNTPAAMQLITEYLQCPCLVSLFQLQFPMLFDIGTTTCASTTNVYTQSSVMVPVSSSTLSAASSSLQTQPQQPQQPQQPHSNLFSHPLRPSLPLHFFNSVYIFPVTDEESTNIQNNRLQCYEDAKEQYNCSIKNTPKSPANQHLLLKEPKKTDFLEDDEEFTRVVMNNSYFFAPIQPISPFSSITSTSQVLLEQYPQPIHVDPTLKQSIPLPQLHLFPLSQISKVPIFHQPITQYSPFVDWDTLQDVKYIVPEQTLQATTASSLLVEFIDPSLFVSPFFYPLQPSPDQITESQSPSFSPISMPLSHYQSHAILSTIEAFIPFPIQSPSHLKSAVLTSTSRPTASSFSNSSKNSTTQLRTINSSHITYQGGFYLYWAPNNRTPLEHITDSFILPSSALNSSKLIKQAQLQNSPNTNTNNNSLLDPNLNYLTTHEKNTFLYQLSHFYNLLPPNLPMGTCSNITIYSPLDAQHPITSRMAKTDLRNDLSAKPIERDYDITLTYGTFTFPSLLAGLNKILPLIVPSVDLSALLVPLLEEPKPAAILQQKQIKLLRELSALPDDDIKIKNDYTQAINTLPVVKNGLLNAIGHGILTSGNNTEYLSPIHHKIQQAFQFDPFFKLDVIDSCLITEGVHFTQAIQYFDIWINNDIPFHDEESIQRYHQAQEQYQYDLYISKLKTASVATTLDNIDIDIDIPVQIICTPNDTISPPPAPEPEHVIPSLLPFSLYELALLRNGHKHHPYYKSTLKSITSTLHAAKAAQTHSNEQSSSSSSSPSTSQNASSSSENTPPTQTTQSEIEIDFHELTTLQNIIPTLLQTLRSILMSPITTTSYMLLPISQRMELFQIFKSPVLNETAPSSYAALHEQDLSPSGSVSNPTSSQSPISSGLIETIQFGADIQIPIQYQQLFTTICKQFFNSLPPFHTRFSRLSPENQAHFHQTHLSPVLSSPLAQLYVLFGHNIGQYAWAMYDALFNPVFTRYMLGQKSLSGTISHQSHSLVNVQGIFNEMKRSTLQSILVKTLDYDVPRNSGTDPCSLITPSSESTRNNIDKQQNEQIGKPIKTTSKPLPCAIHQLLYPHLPDSLNALLTTHNLNVISTLKSLKGNHINGNNTHGPSFNLEEVSAINNPLHYFTLVNPNITQFIHSNPFNPIIHQKYNPEDDNEDGELSNKTKTLHTPFDLNSTPDILQLPGNPKNDNIFNRFSQLYTADNEIDQNGKKFAKKANLVLKPHSQVITPQQLIFPTISPSISALDESFLATHLYNKHVPAFATIMDQLKIDQINDEELSSLSTPNNTTTRQFTNNLSRLDYISLAVQYHTSEYHSLPATLLEQPEVQKNPIPNALSLKYINLRLSMINDAHQQLYTLVNDAIQLLIRSLLVLKRIQNNGRGLPQIGYQMLLNWFNTTCFNSMGKITKQLHYAMVQLILSHCMVLGFDCMIENVPNTFGLPPHQVKPSKQLPNSPNTQIGANPGQNIAEIAGIFAFDDLDDDNGEDSPHTHLHSSISTDLRQTNRENDPLTQLYQQTGRNQAQYFNPIFNPYWDNMQQLLQLALVASTGVRKSLIFDDRKL